MIRSQIKQIADANNAYCIILNKRNRGMTTRYAIYLDNGENGSLTVLWPYNQAVLTDDKVFRLLPHQVYFKSEKWNLPAFHFAVSGHGTNHFNEIKIMLQRINPDIIVSGLNGWSPSNN